VALAELLARIDELGGEEAYPVVPLELFFDGNDDPASIGPNLEPHPGMETFARILRAIRDRDEVSDVVLQVSEVLGEDEWPFVDAAYVLTSASPQQVHDWARELEPDEYVEDVPQAWPQGDPPPGAPPVPPGHQVVTLFWD
jgi:hypothetical protein